MKLLTQQTLVTFFLSLVCIGLIMAEWAPALLSICMIGFIGSVLLTTKPVDLWQQFKQDKAMVWLTVSYLFLMPSFFYSENLSYLAQRLQIKLPFLLLPFIWPSVQPLPKKNIVIILYSFIGVVFVTCIATFTNYLMNYEEINELYLRSKIMPGPVSHVRFSIMTAFASYIGYYLIKNDEYIRKPSEKYLVGGCALFMFAFLHVYAVRSGLVALYAISFIAVVQQFVRTCDYKKGLMKLGFFIVLGAAGLFFSPTIRNKVINTQTDIEVMKNKENANFNSLSTRVVSYKVAMDIFKENILFGCGQGDLQDENNRIFREKYPEITTPIIPHNQFIFYLAATGLIGLIIFIISFFAPLFVNQNYRNDLLLMHYVVLALSFQTEAMIETQLGVAFSLFFILIPFVKVKEPGYGRFLQPANC